MFPRAWLAVLVTAVTISSASADPTKAALSRQMLAAFQCATYAELAGNKNEQGRLFNVGYQVGRSFIQAARNNEFTSTEANSNVPVIVFLLLNGPSDEFTLGRMFQAITQATFDDVVKDDEFGILLPPEKWHDDVLRKYIAENKFRAANCNLIR